MSFDRLKEKAINPETSTKELSEIAAISKELARLVAVNPSANAMLLNQLAQINDLEINKAIASNPNIPTKILLRLSPQFPAEFFANPVLDLLFLENPNFLADLPYYQLLSLLKFPNLPQWFLEQAIKNRNSQVLLFIAQHPLVTDGIKAKLIATQNSEVCLYLVRQKNLHASLIRKLFEIKIKDNHPFRTRDRRKKLRLAIINNPNTELDILNKLQEDIEYTVRIAARTAIALHPQTSLATIEKLAFDNHSIVDSCQKSNY